MKTLFCGDFENGGGVGAFRAIVTRSPLMLMEPIGPAIPDRHGGLVLMGASRPGLAPQLARPSNWNESWLGHWQS